MASVPPIEIVDVEKVLLSIAPKDADNRVVDAGPYNWVSSDEGVITLEVAADGLSAFAISGAPGAAVVSVTNATGLQDDIAITVKLGAPSALNLSAGAPQPEVPAAVPDGGVVNPGDMPAATDAAPAPAPADAPAADAPPAG